MSFPFTPPGDATSVSASVLLDAMRCWRCARDAGRAAQPALHAQLSPEGLGMLAPVLDGLLTALEAAQGRPFAPVLDDEDALSGSDERLLLELLGGDGAVRIGSLMAEEILRVAARSVVIMMGLEAEEAADPSGRVPVLYFDVAPSAQDAVSNGA